jgi:magnesium chelatase family protein
VNPITPLDERKQPLRDIEPQAEGPMASVPSHGRIVERQIRPVPHVIMAAFDRRYIAVLMIDPRGAGKTMLAQRVPTIVPPLTDEEAIQVTAQIARAAR